MALGFDYALYYAWVLAERFADARLARKEQMVSQALAGYPTLVAGAVDLAQQAGILDLAQQLRHLSVPVPTASPQAWPELADRLWLFLQARNLAQDWQFTEKQIDKLQAYFVEPTNCSCNASRVRWSRTGRRSWLGCCPHQRGKTRRWGDAVHEVAHRMYLLLSAIGNRRQKGIYYELVIKVEVEEG